MSEIYKNKSTNDNTKNDSRKSKKDDRKTTFRVYIDYKNKRLHFLYISLYRMLFPEKLQC